MNQPIGAGLRRRSFLVGTGAGAGVIGAIGVAGPAAAAPAAAPLRATRWGGVTSANGWPVLTPGASALTRMTVEGSEVTAVLRSGAAAAVLIHVVRRLHYELAALEPGELLSHGQEREVVADYESNYLSGTAVAVRPGFFPAGAAGGLLPTESALVRDILAECQGVVRWGGDAPVPKESHFQIDVGPQDAGLRRFAATLQTWTQEAGKGAGTPPDVFSRPRRSAASALAARQRL